MKYRIILALLMISCMIFVTCTRASKTLADSSGISEPVSTAIPDISSQQEENPSPQENPSSEDKSSSILVTDDILDTIPNPSNLEPTPEDIHTETPNEQLKPIYNFLIVITIPLNP